MDAGFHLDQLAIDASRDKNRVASKRLTESKPNSGAWRGRDCTVGNINAARIDKSSGCVCDAHRDVGHGLQPQEYHEEPR